MAITQTTYTGNGSTTNYSFTFEYLKQADVKVTLDTVATTAFTFANATTLAFTTAPGNGVAIRIYRDTAIDTLSSTFFPGSAIKAEDLNQNFTQNLYVTQESDFEVATANTTANTAKTTADAATVTANSATTTANSAASDATSAVSTANTASTNATNAVSTANTASTNASNAVSTANTASTNATNAVSTANTASTNATTALNNSRESDGSGGFTSAISKANTAITTANSASSTATTASTNASAAVTTANSASATATAAQNAVNAVVLYDSVTNVASIPGSPSNDDRIEVSDSTNIQSFSPLAGMPTGFTGSSTLAVRLRYTTSGSTWNWVDYRAPDPDARYLTSSLPVVKGDSTNGAGQLTLNCENNSHGVKIKGPPHSAGANYTLTLPNNDGDSGQCLISDGSGNLSWNDLNKISLNAQGYVEIVYGSTNNDRLRTVLDNITIKDEYFSHSFIYTPQYISNDVEIRGDYKLRFQTVTGGGGAYTTFKKNPSATTSVDFTLPDADGSSGQALTTNGSGVLNFSTISTVAICDGGNFANGSSLVQTSTTFDGGSF